MTFALKIWRALLSAAATAGLIASCGNARDGSTGYSAGANFCQQWVDAIIAQATRCTGTADVVVQALVARFNPCLDVEASLATGHMSFDPSFTQACLAETTALPCSRALASASSCAKVYPGAVALGGACLPLNFAALDECQHGAACAMGELCPGTCLATGQLGDACGGPTAKGCDPSLQCDQTLMKCVSPEGQMAAVCTGATCAFGRLCEAFSGPVDLYEMGATGTCEDPPASGPCVFNDDCSNHCAGASPPDVIGMCTPWKMLGESCTPGAKECAPGEYCGVDAQCVILPSLGESCLGNAGEGTDCLDGYCDGTCVPFLKPGDPCVVAGDSLLPPDPCGGFRSECQSGYCAAVCYSSRPCGQLGDVCCPEQQCAAGSGCITGKCLACGGGSGRDCPDGGI
jgi:hypothetical protein